MFRTVPLSITGSFSLYTQQWYLCCSQATEVTIKAAGCNETSLTNCEHPANCHFKQSPSVKLFAFGSHEVRAQVSGFLSLPLRMSGQLAGSFYVLNRTQSTFCPFAPLSPVTIHMQSWCASADQT
jgi:hypothetical protein